MLELTLSSVRGFVVETDATHRSSVKRRVQRSFRPRRADERKRDENEKADLHGAKITNACGFDHRAVGWVAS